VEVGGKELFFSDDAKSGATQFVSASDIAAIAAVKRTGPARATSATGGRLVSLVDGKEYTIPASGATIGREASCEIVVAQSEVSRRHAMVVPADDGYIVKDLSANGVLVNGQKVNQQQVLARADVIRVGTEEFRFYADVKPAAKPSPVAAAPAPPAPVAPTPAAAAPTAPAAPPRPAAPPAAPRPAAPAQPTPPAAGAAQPPARPVAPTPVEAPRAVPQATPRAPTPRAPAAKQAPPKKAPAAPAPVAAKPSEPVKKGTPAWVWLVLLLVVGGATAYFLYGRG
jgi:predicted component of type VI protein secretion system